jgi:hypothetical protein
MAVRFINEPRRKPHKTAVPAIETPAMVPLETWRRARNLNV